MAGKNSPLVRLILVPLGIAGIATGVHRSCVERKLKKLDARQILVDRADSVFWMPTDSFLKREPISGKPACHDAVSYASQKSGWPIRHQGLDSGWKWACLQTPDSGIVLFFAFDSGCARKSGNFWSDQITVHWQAWDLVRAQGGPERHTQSTRSIWTYPGDDRACQPGQPRNPPDSIQLFCGPAPVRY